MDKNTLKEILKNDSSWEARRDAADQLRGFKDKDVIHTLILAMLKDKEWVVRFMSADALGDIGSVEAVDALIKALKDPEPPVVEYAAEALGKIGDERAIEPLFSTLGNQKDLRPIEAAAKALARFSEKVVEKLIKCLDYEKTRIGAIIALGAIGDKIALAPLTALLSNETLSPYCRIRAVNAISNLRDADSVEPLKMALSKVTDQGLVDSITHALKKLGFDPDKLDEMAKAANEKGTSEFLKNLSKVKKGMSEKELTDLIGHPKFSMTSSAALGMFGGKVPASMMNRETWVYGSKFGDFQVVIENGFLDDMSSINRILKDTCSDATKDAETTPLNMCWFCGRARPKEGAAVKVKMYGEVKATVARVQWKQVTIEVGRCAGCEQAHNRVSCWLLIGFVAGWLIVFGLLTASSPGDIVLNAFIALLIGSAGAMLGRGVGILRLPKGVKQDEDVEEYPAIKAKMKEGWEIGGRPPGA